MEELKNPPIASGSVIAKESMIKPVPDMMVFLTKRDKGMLPCFHPYWDMIEIYCGSAPRLPKPLSMLCLEFAGLCGRGRKSSFFIVWNRPSR